jgi:enoyl-CoA hydratase/carnithine racemase
MNFPSYATLQTTLQDRILTVTLDRPDVLNALNTQMAQDLYDLWLMLAACDDAVRVVILTAAGDRAFCAGGDFKERNGLTDAEWNHQHLIFERAVWSIIESPLPVIAAVNGYAYGGGLELVLAADFAYGVTGAKFAFPEVKIGIIPGCGGTQNLPRTVGGRLAKELILTGRPFSADQALEWGVLNRVCEPESLMPAVMETARTIAGNAPLSVRQAKRAIHTGAQLDLTSGLRFELEAYNRLVPTEDRREGILAFIEKRKPVFTGR